MSKFLAYGVFSTVAIAISVQSILKETNHGIHGSAESLFVQKSALILNKVSKSRLHMLAAVNFGIFLLWALFSMLERVIFGKLKNEEILVVQEKFLQFLLFKFLFIGAIVTPQWFEELLLWITWFSVVGFLKVLCWLIKERSDYHTTFNPLVSMPFVLSFSVFCILLFDFLWFWLRFAGFAQNGYSDLLLLAFECFTLFVESINILSKHYLHYVDQGFSGTWESRSIYTYYIDFVSETLLLLATVLHYIQILYLHGISLTLIDIVVLLHLRAAFGHLFQRIEGYRTFRALQEDMNSKYPDVSIEELLELNDVCPICHGKMETAKKLPCGHIFHKSCCTRWLENHRDCPKCHFVLLGAAHTRVPPQDLPPQWIANWFPPIPSFASQNSMFVVSPDMVRRVHEVLPNLSEDDIAADLRRTHSVEMTIHNFLDPNFHNNLIHNNNNNHNDEPGPLLGPSHSMEIPSVDQTQFASKLRTVLKESPETAPSKLKFSDSFAETAEERQKSLLKRKQEMLHQARKQMLSKLQQENQKAEVECSNHDNQTSHLKSE